jgi:hypothetical protein
MRRVSIRRLLACALFLALSVQSVSADPHFRDGSFLSRVKHFIITILDQAGTPPG